jgi:hypothetical protein
MNTLERYHIHKISKNKLHIDDTYIDTHNPIFEILREIDTRQKHTPTPSPHPTYTETDKEHDHTAYSNTTRRREVVAHTRKYTTIYTVNNNIHTYNANRIFTMYVTENIYDKGTIPRTNKNTAVSASSSSSPDDG